MWLGGGYSSSHEKENVATEQLTITGDNHGYIDIPSSTPPMTLLVDSGAEDGSNSSDGEDEEDADGSEQEATPDSRPNSERLSSESGSDSSLVSPLLDAQRRQMVDRLMAEFRDLLNQTIRARGRPSGEGSPGASPSASQGPRQNNSQGSHGNRNQGWSRNQSLSDNGEADGDGKSGEGSSAAGAPEVRLGRKFACPYFKREPRKHRKHRSCVGPGWTTVHRVKYAAPHILCSIYNR